MYDDADNGDDTDDGDSDSDHDSGNYDSDDDDDDDDMIVVVCLPTAMSHRGDSRTRKQGTNCLTVQSCIYRVLFRLSLRPTALQNILKHKFLNK